MFTIHATAKLLTTLKVKPGPAHEPTTRLGNWYATLLAGPRGRIICISERTYLPVIIERCSAVDFQRSLADGLARLLDDLEIPKPLIEQERFAMMQATWAKTQSATVNGVLNEQRANAAYWLDLKPSLPSFNRDAALNIVKLQFPVALTRVAFGLAADARIRPKRPEPSKLPRLGVRMVGEWRPPKFFDTPEGQASVPYGLRPVFERGPRPVFEMEKVVPGNDPDVIARSVRMREAGHPTPAKVLLEELLELDVRCLDAHALLGDLESSLHDEESLGHFENGVSIGSHALGSDFSGVLPWDLTDNRPYLRCLYGQATRLWSLGRTKEAAEVARRLLWLNPTDHQGARELLEDVEKGREWTGD